MQQRNRRRSLRSSVAVAFIALGTVLFALSASPATAQDNTAQDNTAQDNDSAAGQIRILEVSGFLDPVVADFLNKELDRAEADGALAVVLQVDSEGVVIDDADFRALAVRLRDTDLQVGLWVGPSGSAALGGVAELVSVADVVGVSIGSRIGETGSLRLPASGFDAPFGDATERLRTSSVGAAEAVELGFAQGDAGSEEAVVSSVEANSVLREFVRSIDGFVAPTPGDDDPAQLGQVQFRSLSLSGQLFHTAASPEIAYIAFAGGLMLLVFELFTAGVGIAGAIGVALFAMGAYGLDVLPTRWWGVALLIAAIAAFAVDVQTNLPRFYTAVGMVLFTIATFTLYDGVAISWVTIVFGLVGAALYAYSGMPSMVRTRFSTPTIGRSWMIGEVGEAVTDLKPEGTVRIQDAPWRAITNRATPVEAGGRVRVVSIERMLLEVEPEEGGAKDYRDRG